MTGQDLEQVLVRLGHPIRESRAAGLALDAGGDVDDVFRNVCPDVARALETLAWLRETFNAPREIGC